MNDLVAFVDFPAVTPEMLRAYASAAGDPNPIHLDDSVARARGLPGIIAHGMISAAWLADRAESFAREISSAEGSAPWRFRGFQCRFKSMVFVGDRLSIGGRVRDASGGILCLDLQARNERGEITSTAAVEFSR